MIIANNTETGQVHNLQDDLMTSAVELEKEVRLRALNVM